MAKKKILIVDDQDDFRSVLKDALASEHQVFEASNGKIAKEMIAMNNFDLVLSDIQMPHLSGIELLAWVQQYKPTPVILMTGFSQILETKAAFDLGAKDFLTKPFSLSDLQQKVTSILGVSEESVLVAPAKLDEDRDYCHIPIRDFISAKDTEFNLYLRLAENRFVKIAHRGGKIDGQRVAAYNAKGIHFLYIKQEDFRKLVGFTVHVAKALEANTAIDHQKKVHFMGYTGEMIVQNLFVAGVDASSAQGARDFLNTCLDVLTEESQSFALLNMLKDQSDFLYAHSLAVSMFSVMIGKQMGWESPQTLFKLAMGGLFHDIGNKEISREILEKPRALLTQAERHILETHVTRGKEILGSLKNIPSDVVHIAYEHHEDILGQGFPRGLKKIEIHPLALVVSVANIFCEAVIKAYPEDVPMSATEAILQMDLSSQGLDAAAFKALKSLVQNKIKSPV